MYVPEHFQKTRIGVLHEVMREHPFGVLCPSGEGGLDASHVPFLLDAGSGPLDVLHAHASGKNGDRFIFREKWGQIYFPLMTLPPKC